MRLTQAIPAGREVTPDEQYTGLDLSRLAGKDRPYVVCNFVSSLDGKATAAGRTGPLADQADRAVFDLLRTQVDALLAGTGTMRVEHYGVAVRSERLSQIRLAEGRAPQPLCVVISRSGEVPFEAPLFADARSDVVLYAPAGVNPPPCEARLTHHKILAGEDDPQPDPARATARPRRAVAAV